MTLGGRTKWKVKIYSHTPTEHFIGRVWVERGCSPFKPQSGQWKGFAFEYHIKRRTP